MSDDLTLPTQIAIVAALEAEPGVTSRSTVWQHVPEEADLPLTVIEKITATPAGGKGGGLDLIEFEIATLMIAPGREYLTPLMGAIRRTLDGRHLPAQGVLLGEVTFVSSDDGVLDDGQTYFGVQRFQLFAQPA